MKCPKCGGSVDADSTFCANCGAKVSKDEERVVHSAAPAQQAQQIGKKFQGLLKNLSLGEKIMGAGAIASLIGFFLPWLVINKDVAKSLKLEEKSTATDLGNWAYLLVVLAVGSLALLYFSGGAGFKTKIKYTLYHAVVGTLFAAVCVTLYCAISRFEKWMGETAGTLGAAKETIFSFGSGLWLVVIGGLALIVGAFLVQKENLD